MPEGGLGPRLGVKWQVSIKHKSETSLDKAVRGYYTSGRNMKLISAALVFARRSFCTYYTKSVPDSNVLLHEMQPPSRTVSFVTMIAGQPRSAGVSAQAAPALCADPANRMDMIILRGPRPDEAAALTDLCLRSKAVWGYDSHFIEACRSELTFLPAQLRSPLIQVADADGRAIGVVEVVAAGEEAELAKLFVEPASLRAGVGRRLLAWATARARASGAGRMTIDADPGAADFYRRMGAVDDGLVPSGSIPGRLLPRLVILLQESR
jgi:GNAT superfamily N-acetyltransferase